jgi:hypothetical protein
MSDPPAATPPTLPPDPEWKPRWERPEAKSFLNRHLGLLLLSLVALAVLVWLGRLPFRNGNADWALEKALSAVAGADSLHLTVREPGASRGANMQAWATSDGFWRIEGWAGSRLHSLWLRTGEWEVVYNGSERTEIITPMPGVLLADQEITGMGGPVAAKLEVFLRAMKEMDYREWRERTLLRGAWKVVEAQGEASAELSAEGIPYSEGEPVKLRLETDETTDLPRALNLYRMQRGGWRLVCRAECEWNLALPAAACEFKPPKGTKVVSDTWWGDYADRTLAIETTQDWRVLLHAITTNADGDLYLTLSRQALDQGRMEPDREVEMEVKATDDAGSEYYLESCHQSIPGLWGGYFRVILRRGRDAPPAMTADFVVRPYPSGERTNDSVTFKRIGLPTPAIEE